MNVALTLLVLISVSLTIWAFPDVQDSWYSVRSMVLYWNIREDESAVLPSIHIVSEVYATSIQGTMQRISMTVSTSILGYRRCPIIF